MARINALACLDMSTMEALPKYVSTKTNARNLLINAMLMLLVTTMLEAILAHAMLATKMSMEMDETVLISMNAKMEVTNAPR